MKYQPPTPISERYLLVPNSDSQLGRVTLGTLDHSFPRRHNLLARKTEIEVTRVPGDGVRELHFRAPQSLAEEGG
jgi:hypothetical protein